MFAVGKRGLGREGAGGGIVGSGCADTVDIKHRAGGTGGQGADVQAGGVVVGDGGVAVGGLDGADVVEVAAGALGGGGQDGAVAGAASATTSVTAPSDGRAQPDNAEADCTQQPGRKTRRRQDRCEGGSAFVRKRCSAERLNTRAAVQQQGYIGIVVARGGYVFVGLSVFGQPHQVVIAVVVEALQNQVRLVRIAFLEEDLQVSAHAAHRHLLGCPAGGRVHQFDPGLAVDLDDGCLGLARVDFNGLDSSGGGAELDGVWLVHLDISG